MVDKILIKYSLYACEYWHETKEHTLPAKDKMLGLTLVQQEHSLDSPRRLQSTGPKRV